MAVLLKGEYALQMVGGHTHLVEIRKEDGTTYRVALDPNGLPLLCTCEGHRRNWRCKHTAMIHDALATGDGIPRPAGGFMQVVNYYDERAVNGVCLVENDKGVRDPFERCAMDRRER